jgi:MFS family permease
MVLSFVLVTSPAMIFVIFFVWGIVRAAIFGPGRGYIGTRIPFAHKATFMAVYATAMAAFRGLGTLTSGFIVDTRGYDWVFYAAAGVGLLAGLIVLVSVKTSPQKPLNTGRSAISYQPSTHPPAEKAVPLYRHRPFIVQSAIALVYFAAIGLFPFLSLLAVEVAGLAATQVGILFTFGAVVNAVLLIPMGRLADHRSKRTMMIAGLLVTAAGQAVVALSNGFPQLAIGLIIQSTGGAMFGPAAVALLSENIPAARQSTAMGIYGGCEDVGVIIGSALGGVIWSALGATPTFLLVGTTAATLGAAMCFALLKEKSVKKAPAETKVSL